MFVFARLPGVFSDGPCGQSRHRRRISSSDPCQGFGRLLLSPLTFDFFLKVTIVLMRITRTSQQTSTGFGAGWRTFLVCSCRQSEPLSSDPFRGFGSFHFCLLSIPSIIRGASPLGEVHVFAPLVNTSLDGDLTFVIVPIRLVLRSIGRELWQSCPRESVCVCVCAAFMFHRW